MADNRTISFVVSDEMRDLLEAMARKQDRSISGVLRHLISQAAERENAPLKAAEAQRTLARIANPLEKN